MTLRLRRPSACPGSDGWHGRRLDALDALLRSDGFRALIGSARADLDAAGAVSPPTIAAVLRLLVLATRDDTSTAWARSGEMCESYDQLSERSWIKADQLRRAIRVLEHLGAVVETAPPISPTPKHTAGRPPRRALPWLYDHDALGALVTGRRLIVEVDQADTEVAAELPLDPSTPTEERGRVHATPLVDNLTENGERGRVRATHPLASARPSSVSTELDTDTEKALARCELTTNETSSATSTPAEVEETSAGRGEPPIATEWLDLASEVSEVTVDELRAEVLDIWHHYDANIATLDPRDPRLIEYLSTPADRRRELHTARIGLARHVRHLTADDYRPTSAVHR